MKKIDKLQKVASNLTSTLASWLKVALLSRKPSKLNSKNLGTIIVMGNGPSLREAMTENNEVLKKYPLLAVNFSAITPEFKEYRPELYVLADGVFFTPDKSGKVENLWNTMRAVDWEMTLYVPAQYKKYVSALALPANIKVKYYNLTPGEGFDGAMWALYDRGLAMPRPRNVLIPAIICAMREGYHRIVLTGADHNWSKTLWVNERNHVVTVQPHFYKDDDAEVRRVEELYKNIRIHEVYESFAIAFRSYHNLRRYLDARGVSVINATPGSFIDAFPRQPLSEIIEI